MSRLKLRSLIVAVSTYVVLLIVIFIALYQGRVEPIKAKNYVEKKSDIIEVSLGSPVAKKSNISKKKLNNKKNIKKPKKIVKKVRNNKKVAKKVEKKRVKKTKKTVKKTLKKSSKIPLKRADASKLFGSIKNITKDNKIDKNRKNGNNGKLITKKNRAKGIENAYFAKVQNTLKGWPAQSNFAGEKIRVQLTIYQSGLFDYKILYKSLNPEFNAALKRYLEQLKRFGFGPHSNPKPYKIIVEFIAK